jgi:NitT/TauT family transport system ATP-binding protein
MGQSRSDVAASAGDVPLRFEHVSHVYRSSSTPPFRAVDDVSFTVSAGELVSLVGPSGCGKSTLLRLAASLLEPSSGRILVLGREPESARRRRSIGMIFQEPGLVPWRTTLRNVTLPGEIVGLDERTRLSRARRALKMVGLSEFENFRPVQLSGGMKQRAAIARALTLEPSLLLLDEPFGALDHITRERIQVELSTVWSPADLSVVFVTHDVNEAVFLSNRVIVLTAAPARIAGSVSIGLARPRGEEFRSSVAFFDRCCEVRNIIQRTGEAERR